jgi:nitric oxide reductase activation protein
MGFSADEKISTRPDHYHYVKWRNTAKDRHRLLNVLDRNANNFDGYSIRAAHSILKRHPAQKKLLMVISDGRPLCDAYSISSGTGFTDTKMAIREASKDTTVVGLLIGNLDAAIHAEMYGYNFIHVKKVDELFGQLGGYLRKTVKGW